MHEALEIIRVTADLRFWVCADPVQLLKGAHLSGKLKITVVLRAKLDSVKIGVALKRWMVQQKLYNIGKAVRRLGECTFLGVYTVIKLEYVSESLRGLVKT